MYPEGHSAMMPLRGPCICYDPVFEQLEYQGRVTVNVCTFEVMIWIGFHYQIL